MWRWRAEAARESLCCWSDAAASGPTASSALVLGPGQSRALRFVLVSHFIPAAELERCARVPHARRVGAVRDYWDGEIARGTGFSLGDAEVESALRAAQVVLLAGREPWAGRWLPIGNPFQYHDVWIRDGARVIAALATTNHVAIARQLADGLGSLQWPQGPFLTQRGQLDGTGQVLWAFEQAFLRPASDTAAARLAARALRALTWSESQRHLGRESGWPYGVMLPFADPRDGELAQAQLVGNDLWMLAGYGAAGRLCGAAGMKVDSVRVASARQAYTADFMAALARRAAPDVPATWQGTGRDWGNLAAAWPTAGLPAGDPRCERLARRAWARAGGAGLTCYGSEDSLQGYVGADLGVWAMLADHPAEADSVLAATLFWRDATGAGGELFSRSGRDYGVNLPPHPTSAAALVALVRNALIFDDGDSLLLTLAARERWWRGAKVARAPTRWGTLDLAFSRAGDRARWAWTAVPVWTVLRVPPGTRLASAPSPPLRAGPRGHFVLAPPGTRMAEVAIRGDGDSP
jgi:hypothetical protein